jgi:hypothetical protein
LWRGQFEIFAGAVQSRAGKNLLSVARSLKVNAAAVAAKGTRFLWFPPGMGRVG